MPEAESVISGGSTIRPRNRFESLLGVLNKPGDSTVPSMTKPTLSSATKVFKPGETVVGDFTMPDLQGFETDTALKASTEAGETEPTGMTNVEKALGIDLAGTALKTIGGLQNIKQQESDALEQMSIQYGIAREELEANVNLRRIVRGSAEVRGLIDEIKAYEEAKTPGPVQRQFFG